MGTRVYTRVRALRAAVSFRHAKASRGGLRAPWERVSRGVFARVYALRAAAAGLRARGFVRRFATARKRVFPHVFRRRGKASRGGRGAPGDGLACACFSRMRGFLRACPRLACEGLARRSQTVTGRSCAQGAIALFAMAFPGMRACASRTHVLPFVSRRIRAACPCGFAAVPWATMGRACARLPV